METVRDGRQSGAPKELAAVDDADFDIHDVLRGAATWNEYHEAKGSEARISW